jgi:hypothetical protein
MVEAATSKVGFAIEVRGKVGGCATIVVDSETFVEIFGVGPSVEPTRLAVEVPTIGSASAGIVPVEVRGL